tara:strand:- start:2237 stop:2419 length:183 start_codon:yes stop_codon:yes gene_type:complete
MIFRDHNGKLIDIKKLDYTQDSKYYRTILIAKKKELPPHQHDEGRRMLNILCTFRKGAPN